MKKVKITNLPDRRNGMFQMPFAGAIPVSPFGLMKSDKKNLDSTYNDTVKPIDKDKANLEAEAGEVLFKFDAGGIFRVLGNKHSKGGTPLKGDPGDFIFSDDKKLAITKKEAELFDLKYIGKKADNTPAKVLMKEIDLKKYNKFLDTFNNPDSNPIAKTTAQIMLGKYMEKIGQLGYLQESKKNFPNGLPQFSQGTAPVHSDEIVNAQDQAEMFKYGGSFIPKMQYGGYEDMFNQVATSSIQAPGASSRKRKATATDPSTWGLWPGDKLPIFQNRFGVSNAADKIANLNALATQLGYTGPKDNKSFQEWLYNSSPENKAVIDKWHNMYEDPNIGKPANQRNRFDGKIGIRWQNILSELNRGNKPPILHPEFPNLTGLPVTAPNRPSQGDPGPNQFNNVPVVPFTGFDIGMNAQEVLSGISPYLTAASQPTFYDMLTQKYSPAIRLDRANNTQELNDIKQQSSLAQREMFANLPGGIAALASSDVRANEAANLMRSNARVDQQNLGQANQESMINYQTDQQDNMFNLQNIHQTYNNNVLAQQRRNEALANGKTQSIGNFMAIQNNLDTLNQQATAAVMPFLSEVDAMDENGKPIRVQVPPIEFGKNRMPVPTGFGSLDSVGVRQLANTPSSDDYKAAYEYFIKSGVNPDKAAQAATIIFYGRSGQKNAGTYNAQNPYSAMLSSLYNFKG